MVTHFIEATNGGNWGKFMVARLDAQELELRSELPGYEDTYLIYGGGLRTFNHETTLVFDLQTGEGACFTLDDEASNVRHALDKHRIWVCPMYEPFLTWLHQQGLGRGEGDITKLPRFVELDAPGSFAGYRRGGVEA